MNQGPPSDHKSSCCHAKEKKNIDFLLWGCLFGVILLYGMHLFFSQQTEFFPALSYLSESVFQLINTMWWGIAVGILAVGILSKVPREFVLAILGKGGTFGSILRAVFAGILLDLCSHGILLVGSKLYERGASTGQVIAFLVASPWNSLSLTFILIALIGLSWTLVFILFSMVVALMTGLIFDFFVKRKILPSNPNQINLPKEFNFFKEAKIGLKTTQYSPRFFFDIFKNGLLDSRMVLRWILFGVLLASLVRSLISPENFSTFFGPSLLGLGLTLVIATILEVCSEGSTPLAADLLTRAGAPGNSFAFLMTGVATDYTEIMVLKETTRSWKVSLFLPLITVPQVLVIAWLLN